MKKKKKPLVTVLNQINQNPYFGCFEILSLFFGILFLFPIIVLKFYFISYYNHIMSWV